jgi:acyl carrier protein
VAIILSEITYVLRGLLRDDSLELTPQTRFEDLACWDSMDLVTLVVEVECRFNVQFELPEIDRLHSVGDLLTMITEKQSLASAA